MAVQLPTHDQLFEIGDEIGLSFARNDADSFIEILRPFIAAYNVIDAMPDNLPEVKYPRTPGRHPQPEENPHNAWYVKTTVRGAPEGKLKGRTVVLKDNIMLAGVPMMNGAATLEGYVPNVDATVVTRILDAGGTILGKAHCESFCLSGGSHTSALGRCTIHAGAAIPPAVRRPAAPPWLRPARWTWRLVATRAARSAFPRRSAASTA
jgi:amidase